jgi:2-polyprenyl-6-methoxyphenol hydroxylase-like FAD-dependent oxidoreductase
VSLEKDLARRSIYAANTRARLLSKSGRTRRTSKRVKLLRLAGRRAPWCGLPETCWAIGRCRTDGWQERSVIGADGRHSLVPQMVNPWQYHEKPPLLAGYYAYWSGLPMEGRFETYVRPTRGMAAWPTNDDLTVVIAGWPYAEFEANKKDIEGNYLKTFDLVPSFAERLRAASRETRFVGTAVPNFFRRPYGPGWALVGDAGYNKDFITAQGIHDAFRDAELCGTALDEAFGGVRSFDAVMADYHARRDEQVLAMYEFTTELSTLEPLPPDLQQLLAAMAGNQEAMDGFARVNAGVSHQPSFRPAERRVDHVGGNAVH